MIRKLLFSLVVVGCSALAADEAKAMSCFIYCPPGMQQQIIGYQMYPYYTPRLTYDLNYGYAPIYGGMNGYGGYNPYGGGYGPYYGNGYGGYGGYNPNWYNQGFPFSYPRGMVNLRPRSANPSGSGYVGYSSGRSTPRDPKPEPRPSVIPPKPEPEAPKPPVEEVVDCKDLEKISRQRTTLAGDADGKRCDEAAERFKKRTDRVYIVHYNMAESSLCTIRYMDKKDYDKCKPTKPTTPPVVVPPAPPAPATSEPRDRSRDCIVGQEHNCTPAQTFPLPEPSASGCAPGFVQYGKDMNHCVPCNGVGNMIENGNCTCLPEYGIEQLNNGQVRCIPPSRATEGAVPACKDGNCPEAKLPVTDPTKCQYTVGGKVLQFNCTCEGKNKIYPSPAFSQPSSAKQYDSKFEEELNANATMAICMHENMKTGLGRNGHLNCFKPDESGTRSEDGYCFTPEYYTDTFKAFKEAAACFDLNQEEQNQMFAKMAIESKFHTDAVNPGDPSVGIGQIHYGVSAKNRPFTGKELKDSNRYNGYLKDKACLDKFESMRGMMGRFSTRNSADNHLCSAVQSPEQGMFLAMAVFKSKKAAVEAVLNMSCRGLDVKGKDAFDSMDDALKARLTSLAYNMGEGNLQGIICSYAQAKHTTKSSYKSKVGWTLNYNRENIITGGVALDANTSVMPRTGFWGLVQTYYNNVVTNDSKKACIARGASVEECSQLNYVYAMNNRSKATSERTGVQCPKP